MRADRAPPPVMGLFFLATVVGGVGFCAVSTPDHFDKAPVENTALDRSASLAEAKSLGGAAATRSAELTRRQALGEA
jgi:hypothetical protein